MLLVLRYMNFLHGLNMNLLSDIISKYILILCRLSFNFLIVSIPVNKHFTLMQSCLIFAFVAFDFGVKKKKKKIITNTNVKELTANVFV